MENSKQPAFAVSKEMCEASEIETYPYGLTKREYFAGLAMQATDLEIYGNRFGNKWADEVAKDSVQMANALLRALEDKDE